MLAHLTLEIASIVYFDFTENGQIYDVIFDAVGKNSSPTNRAKNSNHAYPVMLQSDHYISFFVSRFDISVRLGNLFQRIASIYDWSYLPRLSKLFEED